MAKSITGIHEGTGVQGVAGESESGSSTVIDVTENADAPTAPTAPTKPTAPPAAAPAPAPAQNTGASHAARPGLVLTVLAVSVFLMILNETVLTVALPQIMADFGITATAGQWLTTGFLLTMAIVIPTTGSLTNRFSTRTLFVAALAVFAVGSVMGALATGFVWLLVARIVQATGTAVIMPLLMTVTVRLVEPARRGAAMGLNSIVIAVAPAIGPSVSGATVSTVGWPWLFAGLAVLAVALLVIGLFTIRIADQRRPANIDALSVVLSAIGFGGVVYALASIGEFMGGGVPWPVIIAAVVGVLGLAAFAARQVVLQRSDAALLDLRPLANRGFAVPMLVLVLGFAVMLGTVMVLPILLQDGLGESAMLAGLVLLPSALVQGAMGPFIGRICDRTGTRPLAIPAALVLIAGQLWMLTIGASTPIWVVICMNVVFSIGMGLLMTPLMSASLGALPPSQDAHGSAILNTLQQVLGASGTAVAVALLSLGTASASRAGLGTAEALVDGSSWAFIGGAIIGAGALVAALCIPRRQSRGA